jgi:hypothetical protein
MTQISLTYQFNTGGEPPTGSQIRVDNADFTLVSKVWVRNMTSDNMDAHKLLTPDPPFPWQAEDHLYLQDFDDHNRFVRYELTAGPVDKDTYVEFPVTFVAMGNPMLAQKTLFILLSGDEAPLVPPVPTPTPGDYMPTNEEVANLIISRTKDKFGNELGLFTDNTRVSDAKVAEIIVQAADDVTTILDTDFPASMNEFVRQAIALKSAAMVERSYYAEQINNNRSPYPQLIEEYEWLMGTPEKPGWLMYSLKREEEETGDPELSGGPHYSFPPADPRIELGSKNL